MHCRFAVVPVSVYQYGCDEKLGLTRRAFGVIHGHNWTVSIARRLVTIDYIICDLGLVAGGWTPPQNWESNDGTDWPMAEGGIAGLQAANGGNHLENHKEKWRGWFNRTKCIGPGETD